MTNIKTFKNRFDSRYRKLILEKLSMKERDNLINSAIPISKEEIDGTIYSKLISIDFSGISSSLFFDKGGNYNSLNQDTSEAFENFLDNLKEINEMGIKVRLRLLFVYPYSDYAFSRIQAECDYERSSVDENEFIRNFDLVNEVDEDTFIGSIYYRNQVDTLKKIQSYIKNKVLSTNDGPNTVKVRFTPIGSSICILKLNNDFYYDPYIFSKKKKDEKKLQVGFPLVIINSTQHRDEFESLEDHFRYLWTLDSTMYCRDATFFDSSVSKGLERIKRPTQITFDSKALRLKENMIKHNSETLSDDQIVEWKFRLNQSIKLSTQTFKRIPERETIFITCSWRENKKGIYEPNEFALKLEKWLNTDFVFENGFKCLDTKLVKAKVGDNLSNNIYKNLNESSLALIIMAKDYTHSKKGYCRPNIYHELGYLMKQLEDTERLAVLIEEDVEIPSNISDKVHLGSFNKTSFEQKYLDILNWFKTSGSYILKEHIDKAVNNHKLRT